MRFRGLPLFSPRAFFSRLVLLLLLFFGVLSGYAQERLFWEFPEVLGNNVNFPQFLSAGDRLAMVWQEFSGTSGGSQGSSITIKARFSPDGDNWGPPVVVVENVPYVWEREVPLFSVVEKPQGLLLIALALGDEGISIYEETSQGNFRTATIIPSDEETINISVAPRLAAKKGGGYILFLTRRFRWVVNGEEKEDLTIWYTESPDGGTWSPTRLFVESGKDLTPDGRELEQNFLPSYFSTDDGEYVAFQSLRQGRRTYSYQIYLKYRKRGEDWRAAVPITESLTPRGGEEGPLEWDNQRPTLGLDDQGRLLMAWERRVEGTPPGIAAAVISSDGQVLPSGLEEVSDSRGLSAYPQIFTARDKTWLLWFDTAGIRLARRDALDSYSREIGTLDAVVSDKELGSSTFAQAARLKGRTYLLWQDRRSGGRRAVLLKPDRLIDTPRYTGGIIDNQISNQSSVRMAWRAPFDSSGIRSHSWLWSQDPQALPSQAEEDQHYRGNEALVDLKEEGVWYFSLIVQDRAGNWSDPLRLTYELDQTPPPPPQIDLPSTDLYGYLLSNTLEMTWQDGEEAPAEGYRWRFDYLGESAQDVNPDDLSPRIILSRDNREMTSTSQQKAFLNNADDGLWAFSVSAQDRAGNLGLPSVQVLPLNKYIPVTYITGGEASNDDLGGLTIKLYGRGFAAGGNISRVIIDEDGAEPWDYQYFLEDKDIRVLSDRVLEIFSTDDLAVGEYRLGVEHPARGLVFWNRTMRLQNFGSVKFGPFGLYEYTSLWEPAPRKFRITVNELLLVLLFLLLGLALVFTIIRLINLTKELREISENARALLVRGPLVSTRREELIMAMKKRGMGLRIKFIIALTSLVSIVILMISLFLGFSWLATGRQVLTQRLRKETALLLETLVFGARKAIPEASLTEILRLPDQMEAMGRDARWVTITGPKTSIEAGELRTSSEGFDYLWASNDPGILPQLKLPESLTEEQWQRVLSRAEGEEETQVLESVFPPGEEGARPRSPAASLDQRMAAARVLSREGLMPNTLSVGTYQLEDDLAETINRLRVEVETDLEKSGVGALITEYEVLGKEFNAALDRSGFNFEAPEVVQLNESLIAQNGAIEDLLLEITNKNVYSFPELDPGDFQTQYPMRLLHRFFPQRFEEVYTNADGSQPYVFYKPILYRSGNASSYFHGIIRVTVSPYTVLDDLNNIRRTILLVTIFGSAASLLLGFLGAMVLSQMMIRPITTLVRGVQQIRNEPDMLQHKNFDISLKTKDELAGLADTINQMVGGLVQAAVANKELMVGREIQKSFIPLEKGQDGLKLSTGGLENDFLRIFGYYEGADAVSGDYFDFKQIDNDHLAMIKCDIAGHGVSASLVMVVVSTLFVDYFREVRELSEKKGKLVFHLDELAFTINELINEIGFQGRFAAFNLSVINMKTGQYWMTHAGDNILHIYEKSTGKMRVDSLAEAPAAGQIDPMLLRMNPKAGYQQVSRSMKKGDVLFLFTDGIEESHHQFRNKKFAVTPFQNLPQEIKNKDKAFVDAGMKPIGDDQDNEEFDIPRIHDVIEAVMHRGTYELVRRGDLVIEKPLHFDFTTLEGRADEAVLALASVEKLFRLAPDPQAGSGDRIRVDRKIDAFFKKHFLEYKQFFRFPQDEGDSSEYIWFSHLKEDEQDDDLTIWAVEKL